MTICDSIYWTENALQWRHNERDQVSNHQPHDCLFNRLFTHRSTKTSKLWVTGLCEGNSPLTGEFPAQRASNAENVSINLMTSSWNCLSVDLLPKKTVCYSTISWRGNGVTLLSWRRFLCNTFLWCRVGITGLKSPAYWPCVQQPI